VVDKVLEAAAEVEEEVDVAREKARAERHQREV